MTIQPKQSFLWNAERRLLPFGAYSDCIEQPLTAPWDGNGGLLSPRRLLRKAWLFAGVCGPELYAGVAICDAGYAAKLFAYAYHVPSGRMFEEGATLPFAFGKEADWLLESDWKIKNYHIYTREGRLYANYIGKEFSLKISMEQNHRGLSFICPSKGNNRPFHFTYKNLPLPSQAELHYRGRTHDFNDLWGSIDFSKGYPPRHTFWNWTSFMGRAADGTPVGVNLVAGFNDDLENALWWGDQARLLDKVRYEYKTPSPQVPWTASNDHQIRLTMPQPLGARRENVRLLAVTSRFIQVFGPMSGQVCSPEGQWLDVQGYGLMEDHEAKW